jgi:type II secretory pathway pseudopilin PulG
MRLKLYSGQSLFEVVVAVGIIAVLIAAIAGLATSSIRNTTFSKNNSLATRYTQEASEWLRSQRDTDWVAFHASAQASAIYCLTTLSLANPGVCDLNDTLDAIAQTIIFREVSFSNIAADSVAATVTATWRDSQGLHQVETSTVLTDWRSQ